jgi:transcriptional regulator with XRE-family HTH domain
METKEIRLTVSEKLRDLRYKNGETLNVVAKQVDIAPSTLSNYENDVTFPKH